MAEFEDAYDRLRQAGSVLGQARSEVADAVTALARLQAERAMQARTADPRDPDAAELLARLDERIAAAEQDLTERRRAAAEAASNHLAEVRGFGRLADPTAEAGRLSGETPLLLLPVRLETRFRDGELWVRIYPDQWAVDTFEERLSDVETESARRFWVGWWRAAGDEDRRRAAWRALVGSHGSGRGGWITRRLRPVDETAEPVRAGADDVVLVVVLDDATVPAADRPAAAAYWAAVWRADTDAAAVDAARTVLVGALGAAGADAVAARPPDNLGEAPPEGVDRSAAVVLVAFLDLPAPTPESTKVTSWTEPARARVLPDRFVVLGFQGRTEVIRAVGEPVPPTLAVGPDPTAAPGDQFRIVDGELVVPDELRWMVDFGAAVDVGMGLRIPLSPATAGGVDRLFAVGLRVGADPADSAQELELLLGHHLHSRTGLAVVPQGTPTNNTEKAGAGYDRADDADASYEWWLGAGSGLTSTPDWAYKQDGQWLAETLGIDPAALGQVPGAAGTDQAEARAANVALWPATWGYFLETMMAPGLSDDTVESTRSFFTSYVSGRGLVPAIRIGRQPYGILPTTVHSRSQQRGESRFLDELDRLLRTISRDWQAHADAVPNVGAPGDPHQTLLDVLGLHPASVEFHQRYAESIEDLFNRLEFDGLGADFFQAVQVLLRVFGARQLLDALGWSGADPDILDKLFHGSQHKLQGPLIDDRPLSETEPVRPYTVDGRNYLRWLVDAGQGSLETLRRQLDFPRGGRPTAVLYLLLRHALLQSWWDSSLRWRFEAGVLDADGLARARHESPFLHVQSGAQTSESRFQPLYSTEAAVTGDDRTLLADFIPGRLDERPSRHLLEVIRAIDLLAGVPTARLERVLAEHLDLCSHRLDAWRLGFVHRRLLAMRGVGDGVAEPPRTGLHLGAYGWLEDVRPEPSRLTGVTLPPALAEAFADPADPPLMRDRTNGGFVHAPSLDHAATAAVLRSGYLANATPAQPDVMAVNISSERMRLAMSVIQGIRRGQTLGSLLGYRLERGLHDRHALAEVDEFIHVLRLAFPSPGDRDGRLVLDGLDLVTHVHRVGDRHYPFGRPGLPAATTAQRTAIDLEVARLLDVHDAIADLALAEGVHQAVLGNPDRVSATMDAFGRGGFPPEPAVLETPRSGRTLVHRFAVHLRPGLDHTASPVTGVPMTPRATAEPAVNQFLARLLPAPSGVRTVVTWTDRAGGAHQRTVSQSDVGLQPIDLLHLLHLGDQAMTELDERIVQVVTDAENLPPDAEIVIRYTERIPGATTFFELAPLVGHLRSLVTLSRPVRTSDAVPPNDARKDVDEAGVRAHRARPAAVLAALGTLRTEAADMVADVDALPDRAATPGQFDALADRTVGLLRDGGSFALPGCGRGGLLERRRELFERLLGLVDEVVVRWERRLADADAHLAADAALPNTATDEERIRLLLLAERALSTQRTDPMPTSGSAYRALVETKRTAFVQALNALRTVRPAAATLPGVRATVAAMLPLSAFDPVPLDLSPVEDGMIQLIGDLRARVAAVEAAAATRITAATGLLADHDAAAPGRPQVDALVAATEALLGTDAVMVPEVVLPEALGQEWESALAWSRTGQLTAHLSAARDFPVDDWLHGVARVRERIRDWEQATLLAGVLSGIEPELWPVQLPHAAEPWLALELPAGTGVPGDRVLYTAHYPVAFDRTVPLCGLLVDEWTEVVPGDVETTGLVFHHDSPDCQPPQAMLLVVPPEPVPGWRWEDVVDSLHETLDLARFRAIEPVRLDDTPYATFLPATVTAASISGVSIATNLAVNNGLLRALGGGDG